MLPFDNKNFDSPFVVRDVKASRFIIDIKRNDMYAAIKKKLNSYKKVYGNLSGYLHAYYLENDRIVLYFSVDPGLSGKYITISRELFEEFKIINDLPPTAIRGILIEIFNESDGEIFDSTHINDDMRTWTSYTKFVNDGIIEPRIDSSEIDELV